MADKWRPGSDPGTPRQRREWLIETEAYVRTAMWEKLTADEKWEVSTAIEYAETDDHCRVLRDMLKVLQKNLRGDVADATFSPTK